MRRSIPPAPRHCALLLVVGTLSACSGDGYITFRGEVVDPPPGTSACTLSIPQFKDSPDAADYSRKIQGHFQETFPVHGNAREYEIALDCTGYVPKSRKVVFADGQFAIDLGPIRMTPAGGTE